MKLSFPPGNLLLDSAGDGSLRITVNGEEVLRTRSEKLAISKFNVLRREMESQFPPHEISAEQKAEALKSMVADSLVQHNSLGGRNKKTTAGSTRTFGG